MQMGSHVDPLGTLTQIRACPLMIEGGGKTQATGAQTGGRELQEPDAKHVVVALPLTVNPELQLKRRTSFVNPNRLPDMVALTGIVRGAEQGSGTHAKALPCQVPLRPQVNVVDWKRWPGVQVALQVEP